MSDEFSSGTNQSSGFFGAVKRLFSSDPNAVDENVDASDGNSNSAASFSTTRREMIERVVALEVKKVVDVMAPRADIFAVDIKTPLPELLRLFAEAGHSRMPIYRDDLDDPVGMVHIKDVVASLAVNGGSSGADDAGDADEPILKTIRRDVLYVPPSMPVTDLLLRMQASRIHMALVIDEYGGTDGLLTIEDLIEEIVGEINDEHDEEEALTITPLAKGGWDVDARVELEEFTQETGLNLQPGDEDIDTVGGLVVSLAGRVPQRGEVLASPIGFDFEIAEADARKVHRIRIRPSGTASAAE